MKTTRILLATILAGVSVACTGPVKPRFEQLAVDTLLSHPMGTCRMEYRFATIANAAKSPVLQTVEQSNINYFFELEEFGGPATGAAAEALTQIARELELPEAATPSVRDMEYEISAESEGSTIDTLLCYAIYRSSYLGGAHGIYSTEYHLYSLRDGYEYTAPDFFGEEKMDALLKLIRTKLYEKYDATDDRGLADNGFFPEYISVTDNFRVTPEGVTFHYNPYEIACYANGPIEVEISNEELAAL